MFHRIALITQCFPPQVGGIQSFMSSVAQALHKRDQDVTIFADGSGPTKHSSGANVFRFTSPKPLRKWRKRILVQKAHRKTPFSVLIFDSWKSAEYIAPYFPNAACVVFAHGNEWLPENNHQKSLRRQKAMQSCSSVIANSAYTRALIEDALGSPSDKISIVHPPAETPSSLWMSRSSTHTIRRFITVARFEERKGQDHTILALAAVRNTHPDVHLTLLGQGPYEHQLRALVKKHQLEENVSFITQADNTKKYHQLQQADAFIMPTRLIPGKSVEGLGISYVEAMLIGLPIIAGNIGGPCEIIHHGKTGYICDGAAISSIQETMLKLINHPNEAFEYAKRAHSFASTSLTSDCFHKKIHMLISNISDHVKHSEKS